MSNKSIHILLFAVGVLCATPAAAQDCTPPSIVLNNPTRNIDLEKIRL